MKTRFASPRAVFSAACLCAAAGASHAQADFSYFGVADFSYGRFEPSGLERVHRFNSNSMSASFGGVTYTYGFENGWTAGATLETFVRFQDMKTGRNDDDPLLSRNAFVSMAQRDYGTLRVGRLQSLLFNTTTRFNAFGNSTGFSPPLRHIFLAGNLIGVQGDFYWNRGVSYTTPNLDGVTAALMFAQGENQRRGNLAAATIVASRGLFSVSVTAQHVHVDDAIADPTHENTWQIGASYNLGLAQVFGQYTHTQDHGLEARSRIVSAGAALPLGPGSVLAQVSVARAGGPALARKQTTTSVGYVYPYDSLTDLYVVAMDDRVRGQTRGLSGAVGVRLRF